jgi:hypothetical protein
MEPTTAKVTAAVEVIRKRIQQVRERKELIGEQNTKAALIDPLLSAMGWELQEIDEVRREYRRKPQDNPVDYALFLNRTECLLIEAKSLEKDLGDRKWISQNISYAAVVGVKWCVLTNGDEYRIYNSHAEVDVDEKLFRKVRISDSEPRFIIDTLVLLSKDKMRGSLLDELWKAHFIDRRVSLALESLLGEDDAPLIRAICKKANGVTRSEARASLKRAKITIDFPLPKVLEQPAAPAVPSVTPKPEASTARREAGNHDRHGRGDPTQPHRRRICESATGAGAHVQRCSAYRINSAWWNRPLRWRMRNPLSGGWHCPEVGARHNTTRTAARD